jgi:hypothetical protein
MSARDRHPPDTPEGAAWELFKEILRAEEEAGHGSNETPRTRMLNLYAECLKAANGRIDDLVRQTYH